MNISVCTNRNCKSVSLDALTMEGNPPPLTQPYDRVGGEGGRESLTVSRLSGMGGGVLTRGRSTLKYNDHTE